MLLVNGTSAHSYLTQKSWNHPKLFFPTLLYTQMLLDPVYSISQYLSDFSIFF